jgi:quercetin dioxygenase-like cupin family protein
MSEDHEQLAAEFALGVLNEDEIIAAAKLYESNEGFALATDQWVSRLAPLADGTSEIHPPAALWDRIDAEIEDGSGGDTIRPDKMSFLPFAPGVDVKVLVHDPKAGRRVALYRMQPGAMIGAHTHIGAEECFVLEGMIQIGPSTIRAGELHFATKDRPHANVFAPQGALLLISYPIAA